MKISNQENWDKGRANNTDPYGNAIYEYAERWANLMEERMENGEALADIAEKTSHEADIEGITGFMYGAAVSVLSSVWEHGETLRRWHNKDVQLNNEGDIANENGTVLNPALLTIN